MKRAALYVRVSTQEQKAHGFSVDSQISALQAFCAEQGYFIQGVYNDAGISARKKYTKRPALLQMIEACKSKQVDIVLFTKLDRFFRSVPDYYACIGQMNNVPWRAIWEDYETETSAGQFKVNIMLSIAQAEADRTSERIKAVNEYQRASGNYVGGKAPTGYMIKKNDLIIDEAKREAVQAYFNEYLRSFNVVQAVNVLHEKGVLVTRETATRMLQNPTYCGETVQGYKCEPYITREQFDLIQKRFEDRRVRTPKESSRVYLFTGLMRCPYCGHNVTGRFKGAGTYKGKVYHSQYYTCNRSMQMLCEGQFSMSERKIEARLLNCLEEQLEDWIISAETAAAPEVDNAAAIKKLEAKLVRIGQRFEDGDISRDEYRAKRDEIKSEISKLKDAQKTKKAPEHLPENWREIYDDLTPENKKIFWNHTVDHIVVPKGKDGRFDIYF